MRSEIVLLIALSSAVCLAQAGSHKTKSIAPARAGFTLAWSDEFDQGDNSAPDPAKWKFEIGGNGWGNQELEYYSSRRENARMRRGNLEIIARKESYTGADGVQRDYTSARLITSGKFEQAYGRFEARIKIPYGQGVWPAFWLLGADDKQVGWPQCGEIDIMENIGREPGMVHGTIHGPGYSGGKGIGGAYSVNAGGSPMTFTFTQWNGSRKRFGSTLTIISTLRAGRRICLPVRSGSTTIPFIFS
jgi:beta-glucanase (GH16 family)